MPPVVDLRLEALVGREVHDGQTPVGLRLEARLGEGGMGAVFLARATDGVRSPWLAPREACVVKVLLPEVVVAEPTLTAISFKKEVVALARLRERVPPCPWVVRWFDAGELSVVVDGAPLVLPWCAMELVDGRPLGTTLDERLARAPDPLEPARAVALVEGIARGLAAVHGVGLVHRDLKPSNVLVCGVPPHELPKLGDFGVARASGVGDTFAVGVGTTGYCAPEQLEGPRPGGGDGIGPWSDVFALGAIVHEIFARVPMFDADNAVQYAGRVLSRSVRPLAARDDLGPAYRGRQALLARLDAVLDRATSPRSPGGGVLGSDLSLPMRHASVAELLDELEPVLDEIRHLGAAPGPSLLHRAGPTRLSFDVGLPAPAPLVSAAVRSDGAALGSTGSELLFYDGVRWAPLPARDGDARTVAVANPCAGTFVVVRSDGELEVLPGGRSPYAFRLPFAVRAVAAVLGDPEDEAFLVAHAAHGEAVVLRVQRRLAVSHARLGMRAPTAAVLAEDGLVVGVVDAGGGAEAVRVDRRGKVTPLALDGRSIHDLALDAVGRLVIGGHDVEKVSALPDGRVFGFSPGTVRERRDGVFALVHRDETLVGLPLRAAMATGACVYLVHADGRVLRGVAPTASA